MEHYRSVILLLMLCLAGVVLKCVQGNEKEKKEKPDEEVFSPTSEWKPLKKDQPIPRGLHVRVNLATGEREAKLLDTSDEDNDSSNKRLSLLPEENVVEESNEQSQVDMSELQRIMQKMMVDGMGETVSPTQEEIERLKSKFRSYAEIKKELKKMEAEVKTDTEILEETLSEYQVLVDDTARDETKKKEEEEHILTFLEYLVHQIDNGQDFIVKMNGYKTVVLPSLNSTHGTVRNEALRLLASAAQNNPLVQKTLVQEGAVSVLLRSLSSDPSSSVKTNALYALSCLIRGYPTGQRVFLEKGGLSILIKQFQSDASEHLKRQLKAVTLIRDLLEESRAAAEDEKTCEGQSCSFAEIKASEYESMALTSRLEDEGWCEALLKLLMRHPQDDEVVEEITREMLLLAKSCSKVYRELATGATETSAWFRNLDSADNIRIQSTLERLKEKIPTSKDKDEL